MDLRHYQDACVSSVLAGWAEASKQLVVLPTGGGKTIVFSTIAARTKGRTLILAHREELITQAADKLTRSTGIIADIEKADRWASESARVVVGSVQTLQGARLNRWAPDHFDLVVCDEAHHAIADGWRKTLSRFDGHANVLGVTATPDRADRRNLGQYFERLAYEVGLVDLIRQGYLSPITIQAIPLRIDLSGVSSTAGDFDAGQVGHALEPHLDAIASAIAERANGRRTLAFLPLIATSQKFVAACVRAGLRAEHVDGVDPYRAEKLERFAGWEYDVLSNAMLLTEGFDDPGIDCVVCLRPTRSRALYSQMIGRGTRVEPLKKDLLLLDFLWMHERHSVCRPAHLVAGSESEADAMIEAEEERAERAGEDAQLDLIESQTDAAAQREEKLRDEIKRCSLKSAKYVSAEQFALAHGSLAAAEWEPTLPWESQPLTEKQTKALRSAKIDIESVRGRGHASQLLNLHFKAQSLVLASPKQRALLERMGHPSPATATVPEFRKFMGQLKAA
jgi:superfamily II DNA or RNA helicase